MNMLVKRIYSFRSVEAEVAYNKLENLYLTELAIALIKQGDPGQGFVYFLDLETGEIDAIPAYNQGDNRVRKDFIYKDKNYTVISSEPLGSSTGIVHTSGLALLNKNQKPRMIAAGGLFLGDHYFIKQFRNKSASQNSLAFKYDEVFLLCCYRPYDKKHNNPLLIMQRSIPNDIAQRIQDAICAQFPPIPGYIMEIESTLSEKELENWYLSLSEIEIETKLKENLFLALKHNDIDIVSRILKLNNIFPSINFEIKDVDDQSLLEIAINYNLPDMVLHLIDLGFPVKEDIKEILTNITITAIQTNNLERYHLINRVRNKVFNSNEEFYKIIIDNFLYVIKNKKVKQLNTLLAILDNDQELKYFIYNALLQIMETESRDILLGVAEINKPIINHIIEHAETESLHAFYNSALQYRLRNVVIAILNSNRVNIGENEIKFAIHYLKHSLKIGDLDLFMEIIKLGDKIPKLFTSLEGEEKQIKNFIFKAAKRNENEFILYMLTLNNVLPSISINMLDKKNQSLLMIAVKNKNLVLAKRLVELGAAYDKKTKVILIQMKIIPSDAEITHKPNLFVDNAKQDTEEKSEEKLPNRLQYRK